MGGVVVSREEHTSTGTGSPENIYTNNITHTEKAIFRNIYVCTYIYVVLISEKEGHEFEGGQEG